MKKYYFKGNIVIVISLFIIIVTACDEQIVEKKGDVILPHNNPPQEWVNLNNPYDSVGEFHNNGLDYIIGYKAQFNCNDSLLLRDQLINYNSDYVCSLGIYEGINCISDLNGIALDYICLRHDETINEIINSQKVDNDAKTEMQDLKTIVESYTDSNNIDGLYNLIIDWEDEILQSNYSYDCKVQLLSSSSVIRYSLHYWNEERILGDLSVWATNPCGSIIKQKKDNIQNGKGSLQIFDCAWEWLKKNWEGVAACAISDGVGAYSGAKANPQDPVTGAVTGGIISTTLTAINWDWQSIRCP